MFDRVSVDPPPALRLVVPEANGVPAGAENGSVTALPDAMVEGKAVPLEAAMVTIGEVIDVVTFTSMFGPRLVSWPQSPIEVALPWGRHHMRKATLVSSAPKLEIVVGLVPWLAVPAGLSPGSQPAAIGPTTPPLIEVLFTAGYAPAATPGWDEVPKLDGLIDGKSTIGTPSFA